MLTAFNLDTLNRSFEIEIPTKVAGMLPLRQYIALLNDERHIAVFNMTPAQSVSIVDIKNKNFAHELSTPGCALMLPVEKGFLMICGDGTLQWIKLNRNGNESDRVRSEAFFSVDEDPVFDRPVPTSDGWQLISYEGLAREVSVSDNEITINEPWSLLSDSDKEEGWRPGGGQLLDVHTELNLMFVIMHQGEADTHEDPGNEIWVFDRGAQRRIARIDMGELVTNLMVTQDEEPLLIVSSLADQMHILDVKTTRKVRSIENPGISPALIQSF